MAETDTRGLGHGRQLFCYRIFRHESDILLAICDSSLLGKTFEEGDLQISVTGTFYHEKTCTIQQAKKLVKSATIVNAVGKGIVALLIKEGVAREANILSVKGIPHAQVITIQ